MEKEIVDDVTPRVTDDPQTRGDPRPAPGERSPQEKARSISEYSREEMAKSNNPDDWAKVDPVDEKAANIHLYRLK